MATPIYGDRPPLHSYRRVVTAPPRSLSFHERAGLDKSDADADILYSHPTARIIKFSPPNESLPSQSKETRPDLDYPVDAIETLPWRSRTETLAATGPMFIEKVRGSSHFLKSADEKVIHGIMRNSQCWCVDGDSKFVLRIGKFRYYRIELPTETEENKQKVEELKAVLRKILRFETTPCPFKRAFHVDLPEDAITPRRKGTWKRKQTPQSATPNTDPLPLRRSKNARAWSLHSQNVPEGLRSFGRRGSDYGFSTSRGSSPRPQFEGDGYRSTTPSSLASSEDASDRRNENESSEDGGHQDEISSKQEGNGVSFTKPDPPESSIASALSIASEEPSNRHVQQDDQSRKPEESVATTAIETSPPEIQDEELMQDIASSNESQEADLEEAAERAVQVPETLQTERDLPEETSRIKSAAFEVSQNDPRQTDEETLSMVKTSEHSDDETTVATSQSAVDEESTLRDSSTSTDQQHIVDFDRSIADFGPPSENSPTGTETVDTKDVEGEPMADQGGSAPKDIDALSRASSVDSFHTTISLTQESLERVDSMDFQKTPNAEQSHPFLPDMRQHHRRELSELTVTASTVDEHSEQHADLRPSTSDSFHKPSTPGLARSSASDSSWPEVHTPISPIHDGVRRRLNAKRSLSPLPPSTTLFLPSPNHGSHFTASFLHKAANVALVKPIEAVALLIHILARIAGGATVNDLLSGDLFRRPEQRRRSSSFPDQASSPRDDSDEDDFGVPIRGRSRSEDVRSNSNAVKDDDADSIFDLD